MLTFYVFNRKLVDLSCNELTEIQLPDSLPPTLQELDLTGNSSLVLEHKTLNLFRYVTAFQETTAKQTTCGFAETHRAGYSVSSV